jgi:hypothetical protein
MGYYTVYKLNIIDAQEWDRDEIIKVLRDGNDNAKIAFEEDGHGCDDLKWYAHEDDMKAFSKKYPKELFELTGEGEESGDLWKKYFRNGKMQICKGEIVYPEFDKSKLKK